MKEREITQLCKIMERIQCSGSETGGYEPAVGNGKR